MEKNKNGLVAFALLGLAVGTAAYYLLGTEDGKKQLDRANEGIKDLTRSIKDISKKEAKKAAKFAKIAKSDLEDLKTRAKDAGKHAIERASEKATDWATKASDAANKFSAKAEDVADKAKSDISNA
ncbi:hypothetical protein FAZ19_14415 [Sphingobacterium alkalisoli]|uniref:YtxH domain-containing protein n=1 Tax=Sphingobacterium alkalisoli TaxID=1874115 RepID=A0A4U0GYY1_9SPHI|nr:hypothetical protein [Sphingobacterium alkalisoli]TJY64393.1 hypothetical protein FAZ19_14415 [Sphingobacterium alkalisoli]GGH22031.1 hypothetical protein GCM10011418_28290 [Sphingobacterium alkalisoli]